MNIQTIEQEALQLPIEYRARLAEKLLSSLNGFSAFVSPPVAKNKNIGSYLHHQIKELNGGEILDLPQRSLPRSAPDFL